MRSREEVEQEIEQIRAARMAVITGAQSYTVGSRSVTKASLAELDKILGDLEAELEIIDNGGCMGHLVGWGGR